ncbi:MAG: hypothetical protein JNJ55_11670 [Betaproteobacteria bacterium]|nr:hypothetical protein [Betaproteobacteria bacterium]
MRLKFMTGVAFAMATLLPARATNYQDVWWVGQQEDGWGMFIVQQSQQLFAAWFVYGQNGQPTWFTWISDPPGSNPAIRTGKVYTRTGTFFGAIPFVANTPREAGTATFNFTSAREAQMNYSFDGTMVSKTITRLSFAPIAISGVYLGGTYRQGAGCSNTNNNGDRLSDPLTLQVTQTATTLQVNELGGALCRYSGSFQQFGVTYEGSGSYTCQGETGTWTAREGTSSETTFSVRMALRPSGDVCTINATIGGFKQPAG